MTNTVQYNPFHKIILNDFVESSGVFARLRTPRQRLAKHSRRQFHHFLNDILNKSNKNSPRKTTDGSGRASCSSSLFQAGRTQEQERGECFHKVHFNIFVWKNIYCFYYDLINLIYKRFSWHFAFRPFASRVPDFLKGQGTARHDRSISILFL